MLEGRSTEYYLLFNHFFWNEAMRVSEIDEFLKDQWQQTFTTP